MRNPRPYVSFILLLIMALALSGCVITEDGQIVFTTPPAVPVPQVPAAEETPAAEEAVAEELLETLEASVNTRSLRVRRAPTTDAPIVAGLSEADAVTVVGRSEDTVWLQIQVPGVDTLGWVSAEFLTTEGDVATLPVVAVEAQAETEPVAEATTEPVAETAPEATAEPVAEATVEPTTEATEEVAEVVAPQIDLVETARAIDEFSTLVAAIDAAALGDVLQSDGPFTVFAPTDSAFSALPEGAVDALLSDPAGDLSQILLYHVVPGRIVAADLSDGLQTESFQGEPLTFSVDGDAVTVNGANVVLTDVEASNGVIHVIDSVLVPSVVDLSAIAAEEPAAEEPVTEEPVTEEPVTEEPVAEEPAAEEPAAEEAVSEEAVSEEEAVAEEAADVLTLEPSSQLAEIATRSLRVRTEPSLDAEVVWGVRAGEFYPVVDQTEDGAWLALAVPELNGIGWVSSEFVTISDDVTVVPTLGSATVVTTDGSRLRVRRAPTTDAELADYLLEGETYEVVAVTEDGAWTLLNLANENNVPIPGPSWVATEFVELQ